MIGLQKKEMRGLGDARGFTLIEMLIVVGIIALLAAVVTPNMGKFIGQGTAGAQGAEWDAVQSAMHAMIADTTAVTITAHDLSTTSTATNDWKALPPDSDAAPLEAYLEKATSKYYYCYDSTGLITEQFQAATACTK